MAQQKIGFFGGLNPTGVDQTAGSKLRALAGISDQVGDIAFKKAATQRQKEGQLAGAQSVQRGEDGKVITDQNVEQDDTIFGRNFNQAAIVAHRAQIGIDTKEELDRIQNEYKLDPEGFKNAVNGSKKGLLNGMPEELAAIVGPDFDLSASSRLSQINKQFFKVETEKNKAVVVESLESLSDDISNAVRAGETEESIELIARSNSKLEAAVEAGLIGAVQAENLRENLKENTIKQNALGQIDSVIFNESISDEHKIVKGYELLKSLRNTDMEDLNADQKDSVLRQVESKINALERGLAARSKSEAKEIDYSNIEKKLQGNRPEIVLDQKKVNSYYNDIIIPKLEGATREEKSAAQAQFVATTKMIPKGLKADINNSLLSGNIDLINDASDTIARLEKTPGLVENIVTPNQRAFSQLVQDLSKNLPPEEAIQKARQLTDPLNKPQVENREAEIVEEKWRDDYVDWVKDDFPTINNISTGTVTKEYKDLFEAYYKSSGDEDKAKEYAETTINRNWKDSDFGFMKYPPELYYDSPPKIMREQLARDIKDRITFDGKEKIDFTEDNLFLMSDKRTGVEAARGQPSYVVMILDNNGEFQRFNYRYQPDDSEFKGKKLDINLKRAREIMQGAEPVSEDVKIATSFSRKL